MSQNPSIENGAVWELAVGSSDNNSEVMTFSEKMTSSGKMTFSGRQRPSLDPCMLPTPIKSILKS